jgi:hypothetical protein
MFKIILKIKKFFTEEPILIHGRNGPAPLNKPYPPPAPPPPPPKEHIVYVRHEYLEVGQRVTSNIKDKE